MIPKVRSVESLILSNQSSEQFIFQFNKLIFLRNAQYLFLQQKECRKILKIKYCDGGLKLIGISRDEYTDLKDHIHWSHNDTSEISKSPEEEYWAVGISYNTSQNANGVISEFTISNERPLDILLYIIQTGAEHVFFSE
ncbi:hypothetical protein SD70_32040 [Gordoniibacillus kamchatkensis]|uniref:Uncharacterized protein n=1 Tax=Gordoniibacillus kamchatkensis TaxID=1590651 RepID=A0ABR5A3J0_9BACL|nr:hypothetical protein [Paenibacillus sp. VKM B-2647]KIL35624.1 hypothetical protein SD70_32040 [Paenibacillus sp. VKM B-2647]